MAAAEASYFGRRRPAGTALPDKLGTERSNARALGGFDGSAVLRQSGSVLTRKFTYFVPPY